MAGIFTLVSVIHWGPDGEKDRSGLVIVILKFSVQNPNRKAKPNAGLAIRQGHFDFAVSGHRHGFVKIDAVVRTSIDHNFCRSPALHTTALVTSGDMQSSDAGPAVRHFCASSNMEYHNVVNYSSIIRSH